MTEKRQLEHEDHTTVIDIARQLLKISGHPRLSYFLFGGFLSVDVAALGAWNMPGPFGTWTFYVLDSVFSCVIGYCAETFVD